MSNGPQARLIICMVGFVLSASGGEFTLKKADHELLLKRGTCAWEMSSGSLQEIRPENKLKMPEGLIGPKLKRFYRDGGEPVLLLAYKSNKEAATLDRVIVDQAANRDFTDDPVLTVGPELPADVKLQFKGQAADYRIYLVPSRLPVGSDIALLPVLWREGMVTVAGKPVRAVMQRVWARHVLVIDYDGDGQFISNPQSQDDWFQVTTYMRIQGTFYKAVFGEDDTHFDLEPFKGELGKLELAGELVPKSNNGFLSIAFTSAKAGPDNFHFDYTVQASLTNQPILVPAGTYSIPYGYVYEQGKNSNFANFSVEEGIDIQPDRVMVLNLGPGKEELTVVQKARTLTINRVTVFKGNPVVTYGSLPSGETRDKALSVDVVDAADPTKVIVGRTNMEYG